MTTYNGAGQPLSVDPPGFTTDDVVSYTYDPTRGDFYADTRTDPVVGSLADTSFGYDVFNRRTSVTGLNGLETVTDYDALDRVTKITRKGPTAAEDLVTENVYNVFVDLFQTILPNGNVLEYGYDPAGRLTSIERKPDALLESHGERTVYTLDEVGNRTLETLERWDGAAWITDSTTKFEYASRCHLDKVITGFGSANESTTAYGYDCEGDLNAVWDANRDRDLDPPSTSYLYDALDRLIEVRQPWGGGAGDAVTTYDYDVQGHLDEVTDAEGTVTTYKYSDRDLLIEEISEVAGTSTYVYNEHGVLTSQTDARGTTVVQGVDALDRVTEMTYPDTSLNVTHAYDDAMKNAVGRLHRVSRGASIIDYEYDHFGRMIQDGDLSYDYDDNGNATKVGYPGGFQAVYGYDFADRQATLTVQDPAPVVQAVVTEASYLASGPLSSATLGNGIVETRRFDERTYPEQIKISGTSVRTFDYQTDDVGNVTQIDEGFPCDAASSLVLSNQMVATTELYESCGTITADNFQVAAPGDVTFRAKDTVALQPGFSVASGAHFAAQASADVSSSRMRTYQYQDAQYFLTEASGPWGTLEWTYDKIGNRLSELRDAMGMGDTYQYAQNAAMTGNTARLTQISLSLGGTRVYTFGPAGHLEEVNAAGNVIDLTSDDASRLASLNRSSENATFSYDGRSFLATATEVGGNFVTPTYSSQGLLYSLSGSHDGGTTTSNRNVFYFAGRPIATFDTTTAQYTFLSTDHLGTPVVATDGNGDELWAGGFEPFGTDWQRGTLQDAQVNGVFLRFPGQWFDETWENASLGLEVFYNVHRWYKPGTGRYTRMDPLQASPNGYGYVDARPTLLVDPLGLLALDPVSCSPFKDGGGDSDNGLGCCYDDLEKAVQQYNELFTPGWRQRKPECWKAIAATPFRTRWRRPLGNQGQLSPLSCMVAGHRDDVMKCDFEFRRGGMGRRGCGVTSDDGETFFRPQICDRSTCSSPLNILFHERLHRCGAPPEMGGLFSDAADIARTCVGP